MNFCHIVLRLSFHIPWFGKCLSGIILRYHLFCFFYLLDPSPVLPFDQFLNIVVSYLLSSFLAVYVRRASVVLVVPSWLQPGISLKLWLVLELLAMEKNKTKQSNIPSFKAEA